MSVGPDIAGLLAAVAALPETSPERRRALGTARNAHNAASAIKAGRKCRTRSIPSERKARTGRTRLQPRDERGRFTRAS